MKWWGWAAGVVMLGALLRLAALDLRVMHTDEAVHAVKFGALLEAGVYRYDRNEYHGPTLNYFTLLPARLAGEKTLAELSEPTLRIVPALFGIALILLILSLRAAGPAAMAAAAFLAASSPIMSYYSRYYIQETLLVFFTMSLIVAAYRLLLTGRTRWALVAGVSAGLMFATKETWVLSIGAMCVSLLVTSQIRGRRSADLIPPSGARIRLHHVAMGVVAGIAVSILFFSSFFTHWEGVRDSLLAYGTYIGRAGEESRHGHPWYYFLRMLIWWNNGPGPVWSEAAIVLFGVIGIAGSFPGIAGNSASHPEATGNAGPRLAMPVAGGLAADLRIFLAVYACLMLVIISAPPYKTPWLVLEALLPLVIMAGWGVTEFLARLPARLKIPGYLLLAILGGHLAWQSYLANFKLYDDPSNPAVYSHPTDDVRQIAKLVENAAGGAPGDLPVQVVVSGDEYWPLPWYLRRVQHVGWWGGISDEFRPTPVILVSPDRERELLARLYEAPPPGERPLYVPLFKGPMYLRPGREVRGYVTLDLWNRLRKSGE